MADRIVRKIPASESGAGNTIHTKSGKVYRITQNPDKRVHTIWEVVQGGFRKIASADSPLKLHKYVQE